MMPNRRLMLLAIPAIIGVAGCRPSFFMPAAVGPSPDHATMCTEPLGCTPPPVAQCKPDNGCRPPILPLPQAPPVDDSEYRRSEPPAAPCDPCTADPPAPPTPRPLQADVEPFVPPTPAGQAPQPDADGTWSIPPWWMPQFPAPQSDQGLPYWGAP